MRVTGRSQNRFDHKLINEQLLEATHRWQNHHTPGEAHAVYPYGSAVVAILLKELLGHSLATHNEFNTIELCYSSSTVGLAACKSVRRDPHTSSKHDTMAAVKTVFITTSASTAAGSHSSVAALSRCSASYFISLERVAWSRPAYPQWTLNMNTRDCFLWCLCVCLLEQCLDRRPCCL